jgi:hypothetical protein
MLSHYQTLVERVKHSSTIYFISRTALQDRQFFYRQVFTIQGNSIFISRVITTVQLDFLTLVGLAVFVTARIAVTGSRGETLFTFFRSAIIKHTTQPGATVS